MNGMKPEENEERPRKRNNPNIFSTLFFWWMCPVFITGNRRDVEETDLIYPPKKYDSDSVGGYLEGYWFAEYEKATRENREPKLWKALLKAYWVSYLPGTIYIAIISGLRLYQPQIFAQLLSYWSIESNMERIDAMFYALAMLGMNFINMMCQHHNSLFVGRFGLKVKIACSSLLYRKLLRISQVSIGDLAGGKMVNLLSNDIARFDYAFMFLHYLWVVPIQLAIVLYFLWEAAGYAPFVGIFSVLFLIFPVQSGLTKLTASIRRETAQKTDRRIKLMTEIIDGIQVIKMYAWEKPFQIVVKTVRTIELYALRKSLYVRSIFLGFMMFTERLIMFVTCLILLLSGNMITATLIYPIQQYFSIIQMNLTLIIPYAIASLSEMLVSLERIQNVLVMEERQDLCMLHASKENVNPDMFSHSKKHDEPTYIIPKKIIQKGEYAGGIDGELVTRPLAVNVEYPIDITNVSASWSDVKGPDDLTLRDVTLKLRPGTLCAVIGPVGSGKSSFLQLLLKELPPTQGTVSVNGRVSFACQESWLFPATVRDNILFGLPYDPPKYKEVCKVCCLLPDFQQFPYGDRSLVGERGVSLSGGQKARINLARAIYRDADIYLLDDPLSAVDANVGRMLFEGCITGYLRGRTCVLVTHQIHYLKSADIIVILNEGSIESIGNFEEITKTGKEYSKLLLRQESKSTETDGGQKRPSFKRGVSKISNNDDDIDAVKKQIQEAEERTKGTLKFQIILKYLKAVKSIPLLLLTILVLTICQLSATLADYWLSYWTNQVDRHLQELPEGEEVGTEWDLEIGNYTTAIYLTVYGCLVLSVIIFAQARIIAFVSLAMRASLNLHNKIYSKLIVALMRFFDTNPSGRVLNRFSKDMGAIDEFLPRSFLELLQTYLSTASILVLNGLALPWTLIPSVVLLTLFVILLVYYIKSAQAVKRLEGTTKSPVFGMINSTMSGLSTIRSSNSQQRLLTGFDNAQNLHTSAFYTYIGGTNAFGLYLDGLCLLYLAVIMGLFLGIDFTSIIEVGSVGLAVSQSMVLTFMLQMAARFTADFLGQMTAVERVLEYTNLPTEDNINTGAIKPSEEWPAQGNIKFENVFLRYGPEDPPVLKNLCFDLKAGWKVGVVGRTGAGKSSLISALFRLYNIEGNIKIDGVNTLDVAKTELRSKISIIPQEPVLFSATIRYNLDPFEAYSDEDIWRALEQVELKEVIPALDFKVSEGGSNFSMGQRQLVCLARAILRSNTILVMDEATANVDPQTDALIQMTIRREFASCTVLTIAHRLNTIMDSDRVLVMDKGIAAEFDHPHLLLSDRSSIFSFMVRETGESMSQALHEIAKTTYENNTKLKQ